MKRRDSVVYWPPTPPNMPFQRQRKCIFHWRGWAWLTIWDRVKIPQYSHRLMHQKRVTCELHDSYFRSMTVKHAIPKMAKVHIPMASYGEILSGRELLYNWVHKKFNQSLETRCGRESQHPAESWASGWATLENGKETLMAIRVGRSICCSSVWSPTPSHTQPFQIKWEIHIFLKNCVARLHCVVMILHACICIWVYNNRCWMIGWVKGYI